MEKSVLVWRAREGNVFSRENVRDNAQKTMEIGSSYSKIDKEAFKNNIKVHKVVLDKSVKEIGQESFSGCTALRHIELGNVRIIRKSAFYNCARLLSVRIPKSTDYIGAGAFSLCKRLQEAEMETSGCREINNETFLGCVSLEHVVLPDSVISIGSRAFYRCTALKSIKLPEGLKKIGNEAFYQNGISEIRLPLTLETIGEGAFLKCKELEYAEIPKHVKKIGKWAFHGCSRLKVLEIAHDPEDIGEWIVNKSTTIRCRKNSRVDDYCKNAGFETEYIEEVGEIS